MNDDDELVKKMEIKMDEINVNFQMSEEQLKEIHSLLMGATDNSRKHFLKRNVIGFKL